MKQIKSLFLLGICFLATFSMFHCSAQNTPTGTGKKGSAARQTVVYLVRHAEKAANNGTMTDDPDLSEAGRARAEVLRTQLASVPVAGFFATQYKRTQQTLQPLATAKKATVQSYDAKDPAGLVQKIKQDFAGKTVVVAGHSNTVLPLIEALGGIKPFAEITDSQYDFLFKVTLNEGKEPTVEVQKYGAPSSASTN
ncbi:histidine phosphatase family protein [Rufibacter latericius]|uniref:Histidine phosphatase family protein n=1 Tax=Rufibacter latericius TaxID=2487040 RepID=A0A3M9MLA5_9BACT|nr:histidine phosphatase family protein [Rufibacter latericius]RNI25663.1 histidine phosphatase family protein [Rufibacter latericius]